MWHQSLRYYDLIRNPRVSFRGHTDSIQVAETVVEIHAEDDDDEPASTLTRPGLDMDPITNMDLLLDDDWATQDFGSLNRRPPRSQQPRPTNRDQNRGSCFF